jgi:hypothetical protein
MIHLLETAWNQSSNGHTDVQRAKVQSVRQIKNEASQQ